jgi:curved DNA-binding protein CbpA
MNPYHILGVKRGDDDQRIRAAYLTAVKQDSPESSPERFKEIASAYEKIKDEQSRHQYELFNMESPAASPLDAFLQFAQSPSQNSPLSAEAMKDFLRHCSKP